MKAGNLLMISTNVECLRQNCTTWYVLSRSINHVASLLVNLLDSQPVYLESGQTAEPRNSLADGETDPSAVCLHFV
jgi:hypothetical protein